MGMGIGRNANFKGVKFYSSSADTFNMVSLLGCEFEHINDIKVLLKYFDDGYVGEGIVLN